MASTTTTSIPQSFSGESTRKNMTGAISTEEKEVLLKQINDSTKKLKRSDIKYLEKQTNLSLLPYPFGELCYIKHCFSNLNTNTYYLLLSMLVYGFDYNVLTSTKDPKQNKSVIDLNFINDFRLMVNDPVISKFLKKTPAYSKGCFDNIGCFGVTHGVNANRQTVSPITGPTQHTSSLVENLLEKIHPGATQELENFCNKIRTRAWMSLPKGSFGSLASIVSKLNGVLEAFQAIISDLYQGCIEIIQKMYAAINGIVSQIQKKLLSLINDIIPLDLLCLILDTLQVLMDDINFFTSMFQMSGSFLNYLNTFQNYLNTASQLVSNPFATIQSYLPSDVTNIIDMVNQIGADPNGYLADQLNNYGYGYVLNALQGNLVGAIVNKYGAQYASITPLGNILTKGTAIYSRFGGQFPPMPATMGPNIYTGSSGTTNIDINGNPFNNIGQTFVSDFNNLTNSIGDLFNNKPSVTK